MRAMIRSAFLGLVAAFFLAVPASAEEPVDFAQLMKPSPIGDKVLGDPAAPVTMIEYASLTCPHCAAFYKDTFDALKAKYIDTGKVRFILREFPLDELALAAVMGARCAPAEAFFPIIDMLFREQENWAFIDNPGPALIERLARHGLGEEAFMKCLDDRDLQIKIVGIGDEANTRFGVNGTPAFFFNGVKHDGEITIEQIDALIAPMLPKT